MCQRDGFQNGAQRGLGEAKDVVLVAGRISGVSRFSTLDALNQGTGRRASSDPGALQGSPGIDLGNDVWIDVVVTRVQPRRSAVNDASAVVTHDPSELTISSGVHAQAVPEPA